MKLKSIRKQNKKGVNFSSFTDMIFQFGLMILVAGAIALSLSSFSDTLTAGSDEALTVSNGSAGLLNFSSLFGTNGTLLGVGLLITIVLGTFASKKLKN